MRVYKNDMYDGRGLTWQPWGNDAQCGMEEPWPWLPYLCMPYCKYPPEPPRCKFPCPEPVPYPYPVPCPCPKHEECPKPEPKPEHRREEAFGYFASITAGGAFAGGNIPFTFSSNLNDDVTLVTPSNTAIRIEDPGIYRVVYSVTTTAAASNVSLQLLLNNIPVSNSQIPIQEGVNVNEIFLFLNRGDTLSLNLTGPVNLANGKNASLLVQFVARR